MIVDPHEAERELRDEPPSLAGSPLDSTIVGDPRLDATDAEVRAAIETIEADTEADRDG